MAVNRILYILVLLILCAFFVLYIDKLSLIILIFAILLPIISLIMSIIARKNLTFKMNAEKLSISKDTPIVITIDMKNKSIIPVANVVLFFEYFNSLDGKIQTMTITVPSAPKSNNNISFKIHSEYCGIVNVKLFDTKLYDNLKLFCLRKRHQQECSIMVMPKYHDIQMTIENVANEVLESDTFSKTKSGDDCSEVFDIREYQEGDRLNRVHWKLSSKAEQTYVKEYSLPISNAVVIIPEVVSIKNKNLISTMDIVTEILLSISQKLNYNEVTHTIAMYQNKDVTLETITDDEKTFGLINQMVSNGLNNITEPYAFKYFQAVNEKSSYSHLIYITNVLDIKTLSMIEDFNATKKTIFYVSNDEIDSQFLNYDGIQIVQIVNNMISASIGEFII